MCIYNKDTLRISVLEWKLNLRFGNGIIYHLNGKRVLFHWGNLCSLVPDLSSHFFPVHFLQPITELCWIGSYYIYVLLTTHALWRHCHTGPLAA